MTITTTIRLFVATCFLGTFMVHADTPLTTNVCAVLQHPSQFNGKEIRISGKVQSGFERFVLTDSDCGDIWLSYPDNSISPPPNFQIEKTETLDNLRQILHGGTFKATIAGRFDSVEEIVSGRTVKRLKKQKPGKSYSLRYQSNGFGHLDQYRARIVIREVTEVEAIQNLNHTEIMPLGH